MPFWRDQRWSLFSFLRLWSRLFSRPVSGAKSLFGSEFLISLGRSASLLPTFGKHQRFAIARLLCVFFFSPERFLFFVAAQTNIVACAPHPEERLLENSTDPLSPFLSVRI